MAVQKLRVICLAFLILLLQECSLAGFSKTIRLKAKFDPGKQHSSRIPLAIGMDDFVEGISAKDKKLMSDIIRAGKERDWSAAQRAFRASTKSAAPIFNVAMAAALRCGQFKQGVELFDQLAQRNLSKTLKSYCCAIRLQGELRDGSKFLDYWGEVQKTSLWRDNESACSVMCATLFAASRAGNVTFAAELLDMMRSRGKVLNALDWNQALDACKIAGKPNAAKYLLDMMIKSGVQPDDVTFSLVVAAHDGQPMERISEVERCRTRQGVSLSSGLLEELVSAILGVGGLKTATFIHAKQARIAVLQTPFHHRAEATRLLDLAKSQEIEQSSLVKVLAAAVQEAEE